MAGDIIVLKFGGSVLRSHADVPTAVHEIYRWYRAGWRVVVIAQPTAAGDGAFAAVFGSALDRVGIPARMVDLREVCSSTLLDGSTSRLRVTQLQTSLKLAPVLVLAGLAHDRLCGLPISEPQDSDHFAVYLAHALRANRCRLLKDVDGVYEADPAVAPPSSLQRFSALGYSDALELATTLIQPNTVRLLDRYSARAEVAAIASPYESVIGRFGRTPAQRAAVTPTRVLMLGRGEIGRGIHDRIAAMSEHFTIVGALIRDRCKHAAPSTVLFDSVNAAMNQQPDVVIDALPGLEPAHSLVSHFLERGVSVISANIPLMAELGRKLGGLAARCNAYLKYSAAVGGSAPMLETLRRELHHHDVSSISVVFSGLANQLLDRCAQGIPLNELILNAAGETGAGRLHEELSGAHAVHKLRVLSRHAFGRDPDALRVAALDVEALQRACDGLTENCTLRLVARAWKISHCVFGQLQMETLGKYDPLAQGSPEWNKLLITRSNGQELLIQGRGAGRWPVTEALMADLLDVRFAQLASATFASRFR
ncbi:hypothetical protein JM946_03060 [Steroidobacter sp. S1-65]|uniref:Homoserine dehydrogenase n=1 Tax=Steroidobacter gossypii TaxID=2805490 RepID=A0ABS1WRY0_9GAMM|nr:hypothetical protein [Steroidobacter gossypii]MBM0103703.1 hypothetical protein [Steroidobacter gossypii]